jgi:hypothetical protein
VDIRRLLNVTARVQSQISLLGICGGRSGIGAAFLSALVFLLPVLIELMLHFSLYHLALVQWKIYGLSTKELGLIPPEE